MFIQKEYISLSMTKQIKIVSTPSDLLEWPSSLWQINEVFTDGTAMHHLYAVDEKAPIEKGNWCYDSEADNCLTKCLRTDPNGYWSKHSQKICCTTDPKLIADGVPGISEEFLKQFVAVQGKGKVMMELVGRCPLETCDNPACRKGCIEVEMVTKLWKGNAILSIEGEETLLDAVKHISPTKEGKSLTKVVESVEDAAKNYAYSLREDLYFERNQYAKNKAWALLVRGFEAGAEWQKQQSGNEAIEFAAYISESSIESIKNLYDIWQENQKKSKTP